MFYDKKQSQLIIHSGSLAEQFPELHSAIVNSIKALAKETIHSHPKNLAMNVQCLTDILESIPFDSEKEILTSWIISLEVDQIPAFQDALCDSIYSLVAESNSDTNVISHDIYILTELLKLFNLSETQLQQITDFS